MTISSDTESLILATLIEMDDADDWPSLRSIARKLGLSHATVNIGMHRLGELGHAELRGASAGATGKRWKPTDSGRQHAATLAAPSALRKKWRAGKRAAKRRAVRRASTRTAAE